MRKSIQEYRDDYERSLLSGDIEYMNVLKNEIISKYGYSDGNDIVKMFDDDLKRKYLDDNVRMEDERDRLNVRSEESKIEKVLFGSFPNLLSKVNKIIK